MATNGNFGHQDQYKGPADSYPATSGGAPPPTTSGGNSNLSKDEVGWYFVEQYYTTLSKSPEKLHLFYSKRSQFVYGMEAEVSHVAVGRTDIQERIKQLDFQDCKVRVSNVDSQASFENIVIQVIGETSIKQAEPKKFVQTFVLAQQPSGYFVLNDILRYIDEEADEEADGTPDKTAAAASDPAVEPVTIVQPAKAEDPVDEPTPQPLDASVIDEKLEEAGAAKDALSATTSTNSTTVSAKGDASSKTDEATEEVPDPDTTAQQLAEEDAKLSEKPKDPTPTPIVPARAVAPVAEPVKPAAPVAAPAPPTPQKPLTWANRAAAAAGTSSVVRPVIPLPKTATPPATTPTRAPAPAAAAAAQQTTASPQTAEPANKELSQSGSEWQTAGSESKRQNRPQSISGPPQEKEGTMAYIKYVTEKVKTEDLRSALSSFGELSYFDINRQKNCAFVEFVNPAGYQAAVAANPHVINGESIIVEPRRPKSNAYGGSNYTGRGGLSGRGRGTYDGTRSGSMGRGGLGSGRGRGSAPRGRGAPQAGPA